MTAIHQSELAGLANGEHEVSYGEWIEETEELLILSAFGSGCSSWLDLLNSCNPEYIDRNAPEDCVCVSL